MNLWPFLFVAVAIVFVLLAMHASERKCENFTETKNDMSVFSSLCAQQSGISEEKLGTALQQYSRRTGLPDCSTVETQAVSPLELRNEWTGAGTQYGWKILWQPIKQGISSYSVKFQYDGGCPKGLQEFTLPGEATSFELPQPLRPRFRIMVQAKDSSGSDVGGPALAEFVIPHDPNKWA
ncbi:putative membrane protein [Golden Marseillevirus]|uniref:hypothetical protein n=1 Tax=Golden Marseillevirus TaxID=1720526 RepID=UPI000877AEEE|nr:hypothetical protein GMAR_ORF19 [Golden Marseillevirus]ALX27394.1 putative membrane protein [Golden Marseillevirus]